LTRSGKQPQREGKREGTMTKYETAVTQIPKLKELAHRLTTDPPNRAWISFDNSTKAMSVNMPRTGYSEEYTKLLYDLIGVNGATDFIDAVIKYAVEVSAVKIEEIKKAAIEEMQQTYGSVAPLFEGGSK
jgi:hypothetical protein